MTEDKKFEKALARIGKEMEKMVDPPENNFWGYVSPSPLYINGWTPDSIIMSPETLDVLMNDTTYKIQEIGYDKNNKEVSYKLYDMSLDIEGYQVDKIDLKEFLDRVKDKLIN